MNRCRTGLNLSSLACTSSFVLSKTNVFVYSYEMPYCCIAFSLPLTRHVLVSLFYSFRVVLLSTPPLYAFLTCSGQVYLVISILFFPCGVVSNIFLSCLSRHFLWPGLFALVSRFFLCSLAPNTFLIYFSPGILCPLPRHQVFAPFLSYLCGV